MSKRYHSSVRDHFSSFFFSFSPLSLAWKNMIALCLSFETYLESSQGEILHYSIHNRASLFFFSANESLCTVFMFCTGFKGTA